MARHLLALIAVLGASAGIAAGGDWPQFRGPTGQGLVPDGGLPVKWGPTRNIAWKRAIPGAGWSSPVVAGGRIYLTTSVSLQGRPTGDQSLRALALDAKTGAILWDREVFLQDGGRAPRISDKSSHANPTPVVNVGRLFVHFGHQGTACLDLAGTILWRNTSLTYEPFHGNGGSPALVDGALVFNCDGTDRQFVAALDAGTGKLLWKTDRNAHAARGFSFCTPLAITVNRRKQVVSPGSDVAAAYDPAGGKELWRVRYVGWSVIPRPVFGHGLLFVCIGSELPKLLAIRSGGAGDVTDTHVAWTTRKAVPMTPSLLLIGDELYMVADNGIASCLDAKTGRSHWQERLGGNYSASPLVADGKIYFLSEAGVCTVVKAGQRFEPLARNDLRERTLASPAAAGGALYVRTEKHLYRIQAPEP
jgi:outer membrane protein assembly factor BamB